jgi:hypothetical protein
MECNKICEEVSNMLIAMSNYKIAVGFLIGWALAIIIGNRFAGLIHRIHDNYLQNIKPSEKSTFPIEKWLSFVKPIQASLSPNKWLGFSEVTLFYFCLFIGKIEGIGAWLLFKVAAKWESWTNIVKVPDKIKAVDDFEYLAFRNNLATVVLQKFLIGTIGNILAAFAGIGIFCIIKCLSNSSH